MSDSFQNARRKMPICKGARLKIKRANKHIADIETSIGVLEKGLVVTIGVEPNTGCEFIKCDFAEIDHRETFDDLPTGIGDAIHNLKCALDHVWVETLTRIIPSEDWSASKFPVFPTRDEVERALSNPKKNISTLAPELFRFVLNEIQPYSSGNFAIRTVHELDIEDKHRLLIPIGHYFSIGGIRVESKGEIWPGGTLRTDIPFPHFLEFEQGIHIKNPGRPTFAVMIQYGDLGEEVRVVDTLKIFSRLIAAVVERFERFSL